MLLNLGNYKINHFLVYFQMLNFFLNFFFAMTYDTRFNAKHTFKTLTGISLQDKSRIEHEVSSHVNLGKNTDARNV